MASKERPAVAVIGFSEFLRCLLWEQAFLTISTS